MTIIRPLTSAFRILSINMTVFDLEYQLHDRTTSLDLAPYTAMICDPDPVARTLTCRMEDAIDLLDSIPMTIIRLLYSRQNRLISSELQLGPSPLIGGELIGNVAWYTHSPTYSILQCLYLTSGI